MLNPIREVIRLQNVFLTEAARWSKLIVAFEVIGVASYATLASYLRISILKKIHPITAGSFAASITYLFLSTVSGYYTDKYRFVPRASYRMNLGYARQAEA